MKNKCPKGTVVQTLIFNKDKFSESKAKDWAKEHDFKYGKVDEKENTFRLRQMNPSNLKKDSFRTIELTSGVEAVIGCPAKKYARGGDVEYVKGKNYPVKNISTKEAEKLKLSEFPNFHKTGSISGMKKQYYGKDALLIRSGNYIYNVTSKPELYFTEAYAKGGEIDEYMLEEMISGYKQALLFSTTDYETDESYDANYTVDDFAPKTDANIKKMISAYISKHKDAIGKSGLAYDTVGMDIWYAQAGHGAGFFDHSLDSDVEKELTDGAKALADLPETEIDDDGKIHIRGGKHGYFKNGGKVKKSPFENLEIVWDDENKSYGVVLNNYENDDFGYGEVRLDSDGNQPIENLHKLGSEGDKGTKEQLQECLLAHKRLVENYNYEKVNYKKGGEIGAIKSSIEDIKSIEHIVDYSIRGNSNEIPYDSKMIDDHTYYLSDKEFLEKYAEKIGVSVPDEDEFDENGNMDEFRITEKYIVNFKDDSYLTLDFSVDGDLIEVYASGEDDGEDNLAVKYKEEYEKEGWDMDITELEKTVNKFEKGGGIEGCDCCCPFKTLFGFSPF